MKITIERKLLLTALSIVKSAAMDERTQGSPPVLFNVQINTFDKSVEFICTNLDIALRARVGAEIKSKGSTTVRATLLHDLVRGFADEQVELHLVKDVLHVIFGDSKYRLATLPADEFPPVPRLRDAYEVEVPQSSLRSLLASTLFAVDTDHSTTALNGSLLRLNGNVTVVGCDGKRLAMTSADAEGLGKKTKELIVPRASISQLVRLLDDDEESNSKCRIVAADNLVQFHLGDAVLTSKLIEGNYVKFDEIIPSKSKGGIPIGRVEMLAAVQRCALISSTCRIDARKQSLNIHAIGEGGQGEASENLLIPPSGNLRATFDARHLIDALNAIDDDEVQFFAPPNEPVVLKVAGKPWLSVIVSHREKSEPAKAPEPPKAEEQTTAE
ncbi:MAG TPA: DNA polymerase III subunit beta [Verrucomicrobiae bacterium]|nr:DNA polymerase III subunit beta [Verrucomicrobiae bacterium]